MACHAGVGPAVLPCVWLLHTIVLLVTHLLCVMLFLCVVLLFMASLWCVVHRCMPRRFMYIHGVVIRCSSVYRVYVCDCVVYGWRASCHGVPWSVALWIMRICCDVLLYDVFDCYAVYYTLSSCYTTHYDIALHCVSRCVVVHTHVLTCVV